MNSIKPACTALFAAVGLILLGCSGSQKKAGVEPREPPLTSAAAQGRQIFYARCAVCHQAQPGTPGTGPRLAGIFQTGPYKLADGTEISGSEQSLRDFVRHGNSNMPPIGKDLSPEQMDDLFAYLHTLQRGD